MIQRFLTLFVALSVITFASVAVAQPVAVYNPGNGNIVFNGLTGEIGLSLFAPEESLNKPAATNLGGAAQSVDTGLAGSISWANFGGFQGDGFDAGNIVVPGTGLELLSFETQINFTDRGTGVVELIPEPTSMMLAGLGLAGVFAMRRRIA